LVGGLAGHCRVGWLALWVARGVARR
jgi:hypothetical protein